MRRHAVTVRSIVFCKSNAAGSWRAPVSRTVRRRVRTQLALIRALPPIVIAAALLSFGGSCARQPVEAPAPGRDDAGSPAVAKRIEFSLLEDYDKGDDLGEVAKDFDLFAELGVRTWRGSFGWDDYEPSPGQYEFEWLHRFADLAASRGIALRPYIGYTPAWAAAGGTDGDAWNDPPKRLADWSRFVRALASDMRRHENVRSFEIYNEENVRQWWDGTAAQYRDVLRRGAEGVESGNPRAQVLLGGMVYPDLEWLETVCGDRAVRAGVDVIPFHAYPETWTPADVTVERYLGPAFDASFVAPADAACGRKALWINETGFATVAGRTELDQARWWIRAVATFAAAPRIEHIGIYEIKDLAPNRAAIGDAPNYHLGITRVNREKKMAFGALARLVSLMGTVPLVPGDGAARLVVTAEEGELYHSAFTRTDGRRVLFLWTGGSGATAGVELQDEGARLTEYAADGTPAHVNVSAEALRRVQLAAGEVRYFEIAP